MTAAPRVRAALAAAAVLVSAGLAGCSGSGSQGASGGGSSSAAVATPSGSAGTASGSGGASSGTAAPPSAPAGTTFVQAPASGLRFAVPDDWKVLDPKTLSTDPSSALSKDLQKTYGMGAKQLALVFAQMDVVVLGPARKAFAPNVNVVPNQLTSLPPASDLASQLTSAGAKTGTPRDATTPLGPAILVPYELSNGDQVVHGRSIVLKGPKEYVTVTVSALSEKEADAVANDVLATAAAPTP